METAKDLGKNPTACVLIIGNELLSGQIRDENLPYLSKRLEERGIDLVEARFIQDNIEAIVSTIRAVQPLFNYIFTTGGIGPTHDDITALCVAKAFDKPLVCSLEAYENMRQKYPHSKALDALARMSLIPSGASLIFNRLSAAPGFSVNNVYVLAGVPSIMRAMFEEIEPSLKGGQAPYCREVLIHVVEGIIAKDLERLQNGYIRTEIGSYPQWHEETGHRVNVVVKGYYEADVLEVEKKLLSLAKDYESAV